LALSKHAGAGGIGLIVVDPDDCAMKVSRVAHPTDTLKLTAFAKNTDLARVRPGSVHCRHLQSSLYHIRHHQGMMMIARCVEATSAILDSIPDSSIGPHSHVL